MGKMELATRCFLFLVLFFTFDGNCLAYDDFSGWWYVEDKGGTGVSVEVQEGNCFVAVFDFNNFDPFWISSFGKVENFGIEPGKPAGLYYEGDLYLWSGWPLGSSYLEPQVYRIGIMQIEFLSPSNAELRYVISKDFLTSDSDAGVDVQLVKFMPQLFNGNLDSRDVNGWWYDPAFNGMGFFTEAYGDTIFMAWYHYNEDNEPTWLSCYAPFRPEDSQFVCTMQQWYGGSYMGSTSYKAPVVKDLEEAVFKLTGESQAELTWRGTTYHLERFIFK